MLKSLMLTVLLTAGEVPFCQYWNEMPSPIEKLDFWLSGVPNFRAMIVEKSINIGGVPQEVAEEFADKVMFCFAEDVMDLVDSTDAVCKDSQADKSREVASLAIAKINECGRKVNKEALDGLNKKENE